MMSTGLTALPVASTYHSRCLDSKAMPRFDSSLFHMTSTPDFGIGNGVPPHAPVTVRPLLLALARVAFWMELSW